MAIIRRSISSVLMVVFFLVLAALSTLVYNSNEEQKEQPAENVLYQKAKIVGGVVLAFSQTLADANFNKNLGFGQVIKDKIVKADLSALIPDQLPENYPVGAVAAEPDAETKFGFWTRTKQFFQAEWQKSQDNQIGVETENDNLEINDLFSYEKTASGAEIIIRPKNGAEYKLPLLFKFLSR